MSYKTTWQYKVGCHGLCLNYLKEGQKRKTTLKSFSGSDTEQHLLQNTTLMNSIDSTL
jgi:hypothetical protein